VAGRLSRRGFDGTVVHVDMVSADGDRRANPNDRRQASERIARGTDRLS
jgi:hypothetical protein